MLHNADGSENSFCVECAEHFVSAIRVFKGEEIDEQLEDAPCAYRK